VSHNLLSLQELRLPDTISQSLNEVSMPNPLFDRITTNAAVCGGRPCIRGMRIRVSDLLEMLAAGVTQAEILADFPDLTADDISACLLFAARRIDVPRIAA
jgi:uncharacterized protein (DUF433 family)